MAIVKKTKQLTVETNNEVGKLAEITGVISDANNNIIALNAYAIGDRACFRLVTENVEKVADGFEEKGYKVNREEIVELQLVDEPGKAKQIADKLKQANIDLKYIYGSTCATCSADEECLCRIFFDSSDNDKAVDVLRD